MRNFYKNDNSLKLNSFAFLVVLFFLGVSVVESVENVGITEGGQEEKQWVHNNDEENPKGVIGYEDIEGDKEEKKEEVEKPTPIVVDDKEPVSKPKPKPKSEPEVSYDNSGNRVETVILPDGRKKVTTYYEASVDPNGISIDVGKKEVWYRVNGVIAREVLYRLDGGIDVDSYFDENGNLKRTIGHRPDGSKWKEWVYDGSGGLPKVIEY